MLDFVDISIVFLIVVLVGYAWYTVKVVLSERTQEEQLWIEAQNMHYIPFSLRQLQAGLLGAQNATAGPLVVQWKELLLKSRNNLFFFFFFPFRSFRFVSYPSCFCCSRARVFCSLPFAQGLSLGGL